MLFIVARCDECWRVRLVAQVELRDRAAACSDCGTPLRVMPSGMYREQDVQLFHEISDTLRDGKVRPFEATQLAAELRRVLANGDYDRFFELLSNKTPSFTPIQLHFGGKPSLQLRALRMLATILEALSATRSGTMPAVAEPTLVPNKHRA